MLLAEILKAIGVLIQKVKSENNYVLEQFSKDCRLAIGFKTSRQFINQWEGNQNQSRLAQAISPALRASYVEVLRVWIGLLRYLHLLWLVGVFTLALFYDSQLKTTLFKENYKYTVVRELLCYTLRPAFRLNLVHWLRWKN